MLTTLTRISVISCFIFLSLLTEPLFSVEPQLASQSRFDWHTILFPFEDKIGQAVLFDSANGWASWAEGNQSRLYHLHNGTWQFVPPQNNIYIEKIFGFSPDHIWFICYDKINYHCFLRHQHRENITDYYTPNADRIMQLDFISPYNIWAVCLWGQMMHFDGISWKLVTCPTFTHVTSISMANDSCGWAGGEYRGAGFLLNWDGNQ